MRQRILLTTSLALTAFAAASCAALLPRGKRSVDTTGTVAFVEGPAWKDGGVYFSDVANNRIMRYDATSGEISEYRNPSGRANGLLFDASGRLVACEGAGAGGNRRVSRTEADGSIVALAERYDGSRFNSPNDLAADSRGRIYFTDPRYGPRDDLEMFDGNGKAIEGVYRIDPDGTVERVLAHEVDRPNGIAVSGDDRFLFVVDNNNGVVGGARNLWRFEIDATGRAVEGSRTLLHDFGHGRGGDGMAIGPDGLLYVTAGFNYAKPPIETAETPAGVYVFTTEGDLLEFIPILEDMVTNCTFGGEDNATLWVTAGHTLFKVR